MHQNQVKTYDNFLDITSMLFGGVGSPPTYNIYYSVRPGVMHMALVCENFGGWCAFGWSPNCSMVGSDAVVGYIDSVTSQGYVQDFLLQGKTFPTASSCNSFTVAGNNSACADDVKESVLDCVNNAQFVAGNNTNNTFMTIEFTRPLVASDQCDVTIPLDTAFCAVFSLGQFQSGGSVDPWPNNIAEHSWRAGPTIPDIIWTIPANISTTAGTTGTTGGSTTSTSTSTSAAASSTTGTTGAASTSTPTSAAATSAGTSSTSSPTSGTNCNDLNSKCQSMCGTATVKQCTCVNNAPVAQCGSSSDASIGFVALEFVIGVIAVLLL